MIAPKKKISKTQTRSRHSTWLGLQMKKLANRTNLVKCSNCSQYRLSHRVCPHCGWYGGKQVLTIKSKERQQILEA